ncbi:MAG: thioredoxin [Candidatus Woesearchaeota archaeon]
MMNKNIFRIITFMLLLSMIAGPIDVTAETDDEIVVHFFWGQGCPFCSQQKPQMEELEDKYPDVKFEYHEIHGSRENQELMLEMAKEHGTAVRGVPLTFIGDEHWTGFHEEYIDEMDDKIKELLEQQNGKSHELPGGNVIDVPFVGEVDLNETPFIVTTFLIAFIDGFNPCSLWLLTFLLGILVLTKSRKKMIIVGISFLLTTAIVYGAFIAGLFNVFSYTRFIEQIKWFVGALALIFAIVNIKDYFWYKKGISFTISDKHKPKLFKKMRRIMHPDQSLPSMVGATIALALGVTLVELPCTAGFPMIWSGMAAELSLPTINFLALLGLYLLIYLSVEIVILTTVVITMAKIDFGESHGRILKLISGIIMLVLGVGFVFFYNYMNTFQGLFELILIASALILGTLMIHRKLLPKLGIQIGTEVLASEEDDDDKTHEEKEGKKGDDDE